MEMCFRNRIKLTQAEQSLGVDVLGGLQKTVAVRFLFCFLTKLKLLTIFYLFILCSVFPLLSFQAFNDCSFVSAITPQADH